ncbi:MAG: hypothetical protein AAGF30_07850 [Pseudomonadota bacterium]
MLRRIAILTLAPALLTACAAVDNVYAPLDQVAAYAWQEPGPPKLTLITAINNRSGEGAHSALMVSGSQRVIFDPAGSWWNPDAPERGDVKYGISPPMLDIYVDYHARPAYRMVLQEIEVTHDVAERAIALVEAHGPTGMATCGRSVSGILNQLGFTEVRQSWFPKRIMRDFARLPGVTETVVRDDTEDAHSPGVIVQAQRRR